MILDNENENLKAMATRLAITPSYLSSIENGKRPLTDANAKAILIEYHLNEIAKSELKTAMICSTDKFLLDIEGLSTKKRQMLVLIESNLATMDDETVKKICEIIQTT